MIRVILKKNNMTVYVHEGVKPVQFVNRSKVVVSKQPGSNCIFCVDRSEIVDGYLLD